MVGGFFHIGHQLSLICVGQTFPYAIVPSRLGYCHFFYIGLPLKKLQRLQMVHNAAARLLIRTPWSAHITSILKQLHWLPVSQDTILRIGVNLESL